MAACVAGAYLNKLIVLKLLVGFEVIVGDVEIEGEHLKE